jgi:hypothetical protein
VKFYLGIPNQVSTNVLADMVGYFRRPTNYGGTHTITGLYATDNGGFGNTASGDYSTVAGGYGNAARGASTVVAGGESNIAMADRSTVAGGGGNHTGAGAEGGTIGGGSINNVGGKYGTVAGGYQNSALGDYSFVAGGFTNGAYGKYSFAAGLAARAEEDQCFVFANWSTYPAASPGCLGLVNIARFLLDRGLSVGYSTARTDGGGNRWVDIGDVTANQTISSWTGAYLSDVGVWTNNSDANRKTDFAKINVREVLTQVARLPIASWRYIGEDTSKRHVGPTAQDFWKAFQLGDDDNHIGTIDEGGVALAAIQGLHQMMQQKDREIAQLRRKLEAVETRLGM